jgi:hypothetical protein
MGISLFLVSSLCPPIVVGVDLDIGKWLLVQLFYHVNFGGFLRCEKTAGSSAQGAFQLHQRCNSQSKVKTLDFFHSRVQNNTSAACGSGWGDLPDFLTLLLPPVFEETRHLYNYTYEFSWISC